jgi:quinone-modifying oxidoreductase subunit QmoA
MTSSVDGNKPGIPVDFDKDNFVLPRQTDPGIFAAGCARGPFDVATSVQDATAAVLDAIQTIHGAARMDPGAKREFA